MKELLEFWLYGNEKDASGGFFIEDALRLFKDVTISKKR